MNTDVMTERIAASNPQREARIAGVLFLLTVLGGVIAQSIISDRLVVAGDGAATAANILSHRGLFQAGFAIYMVEMACQVALTALLYELLKPAGRSISLLASFLGLTGCVVKTFARVFYIAPLFVLGGQSYLSVFDSAQAQALAMLLLRLNDQGAGIALVFFGFAAFLRGYLTIRSSFLPGFLGVLSMLTGVGLLTFLYPPLGYRLFPYTAVAGLIASAAWIFWLLVFGVNEQRWKEQARTAAY